MGARRYLAAAALSALLALPVAAQTPSSPASSTHGPAAATPSRAGSPSATQAQSGLIDINSASAQELGKLPGIGTKRAQAIIANRPYRAKDELTQRKVIPPNVYDQIADKIVARQGSTSGSGSSRPMTNSK